MWRLSSGNKRGWLSPIAIPPRSWGTKKQKNNVESWFSLSSILMPIMVLMDVKFCIFQEQEFFSSLWLVTFCICRHEWYQTLTHLVVSIFAKGIKEEDLKVDFGEQIVSFVFGNIFDPMTSLLINCGSLWGKNNGDWSWESYISCLIFHRAVYEQMIWEQNKSAKLLCCKVWCVQFENAPAECGHQLRWWRAIRFPASVVRKGDVQPYICLLFLFSIMNSSLWLGSRVRFSFVISKWSWFWYDS